MTAPSNLPEWNLSQLFSTEKKLNAALSRVEKESHAFESYRLKLQKSPSRNLVEEIMEKQETLSREMSRVGAYSSLLFAEDTRNERAKALESQISQKGTEISNRMLFFGLWWKDLDDKTAQKFLPRNKDHAFSLLQARKQRKHILSEKEEQLANLKDNTGEEALVKLYDVITNAYVFEWKSKGKKEMISEEQLRSHVHSTQAAERKQAYDLLWARFGQDNPVLGEIYRNLVMDNWNENISLRKYSSPLSVRNLSNDLPDEMVNRFLDVCSQNTDVFQEYHAWKAQILHAPLSRYHLYAPISPPHQKWSFEEGYETVMSSYEDFSPRFREQAHRVLRQKRLDAALRKGKRSGAFCAGIVPGETSFVLLNWTHTYNDVSTLAHELGHAIHDHLAEKHSIFTHHAGLPLAETASTFGEMLLNEKILEETKDDETKRYILAHQLDDGYASIQRQSQFSVFEQEAFEMIRDGKTIPELNDAYFANLRAQFGKKMQIPTHARYEWTGIPHFFHSPFYVYAYAFGQLLVFSFYEMYQKEGKDFVKRYEKFLSYGGSAHPEKMLLEMGFDPHKRTSWEKGFRLLRAKMKKLQQL